MNPSANIEPPSSWSTLELGAATHATPARRWLVEVQDTTGTRRIPLGTQPVVVGSAEGCLVRLADPAVSARHCRLSVLGNGVVVEDLGSKNGTYVGSARVREAWASQGASLVVGRSSLVCMSEGEGGPSPSPSPEEKPLPGIAGASSAMLQVASQVRRLAAYSFPVLVSGETGTGKELVARCLHGEGPRRSRPFLVLNVAALPRELVESELFGHERGAFTGAVSRRAGAFAEAEGGTLFLDEIGELPLEAQPKLLRALDGYEVKRVGGEGAGRKTNVRVVAATHVPLEDRVTRGLFRRDLFHRLEAFVVTVPPLRTRRGDVGPIAQAILGHLATEMGRRTLTPRALARLVAHDWPGNVRELRNVLLRAADLAQHAPQLDACHIEDALGAARRAALVPASLSVAHAHRLCEEHGGNVSAAARAAGLPRTSFRKLLAIP